MNRWTTLYFILVSLFSLSCTPHNLYLEGDFIDIYTKSQAANKKLWVIFGGGKECLSCNNLLDDMQKKGIFEKYKDEYNFYKCNIMEPNNKFMQYILLMEQIPNSYIFNENGELVYASSSYENVNSVKLSINIVSDGGKYHYDQNQFISRKMNELLNLHNYTIKANLDYLNGVNSLNLINKSIEIEPYFYNLYLKYKILMRTGDINAADSCNKLVREYTKVGFQSLVYEKLYNELMIGNNVDSIKKAKLKLSTNNINGYKFNFGSSNKLSVEIVNSGSKPLIVYHVSTDCSCLEVDFSKKPIMPNEKSEIKLVYKALGKGAFSKNITIQSNAVNHIERVIVSGVVK